MNLQKEFWRGPAGNSSHLVLQLASIYPPLPAAQTTMKLRGPVCPLSFPPGQGPQLQLNSSSPGGFIGIQTPVRHCSRHATIPAGPRQNSFCRFNFWQPKVPPTQYQTNRPSFSPSPLCPNLHEIGDLFWILAL